jgi:hypothetical protein
MQRHLGKPAIKVARHMSRVVPVDRGPRHARPELRAED